jgi:dissimilatory sulfite reductase alpha subunit
MAKSETPLLDELEKGEWPSFVKDLKQAAAKKPMAQDLMRQLELSYKEKIGHWKHGGIVGVKGYGGGVIGRYSDRPDLFPGVAHFHTMRVNHPTGWFYTTQALRKVCDIWDKYGSGLTNMHGSTGDIILLGTKTEFLQPCFDELSDAGFDLGGSGSALRTPSACVGPARCEWACIDSLDICYNLTMHFQDQLHRPMFPYKFKIKTSACANDCVASIARSDFSIIGTWKGKIDINQKEVQGYASSGINIREEIVDLCPTRCMTWDEGKKELKIADEDCTRCMHCINMMPKALKQGKEKGATLLIGGKAPILHGAQLSTVIVPFMKLEPPYTELKELIAKILDWWDENGKMRERVGELITRVGMRTFLRGVGLKPSAQMVKNPRTNPYVFFWPEDIKKEGK